MIIIGLTGPTGAGKSSVVTVAKRLGFKVIDCDNVAREVTKKGEPVLKILSEHFGKDILENGELNRKELAKRAFSSPQSTQNLNYIIFPFIRKKMSQIVSSEIESGTKYLMFDAPTLYESGTDILCDKVIAVLSNKKTRKKRIIERDSLDENSANLRISAGKSNDFYNKADYIINNNGSMKDFLNNIENILKIIAGGTNNV